MLSLPGSVKVFLCLEVADMRRSFDGLAMMTESIIEQDPLSGHLFVFRNRREDRVKVLYWDRDGLAIWYKRLEQGVFHFPFGENGRVEVDADELGMILGGIELSSVKRYKRFSLKSMAALQKPLSASN